MKLCGQDNTEANRLIESAKEARAFAYTPYSSFTVGAALLTETGEVYTGCNIENAAFTPGNCAERTAIFKAVSEGKRDFTAIAIVGGKEGEELTEGTFCAPCGVCRQVMMEFANPETFRIYLTDGTQVRMYLLKELLPLAFGPKNLE
ncbi:MAG: cytidine deaminase [Lachnospiraceae bacterium]|nr:cytidine deaminase [Lachnospiraceae bacterium]